jgi:hypothetical protein
MFSVNFGAAFHAPVRPHGAAAVAGPRAGVRSLALLARGRRHGPITRLITPWNIGELTTPFVFLDYAEVAPGESLFPASLAPIRPEAEREQVAPRPRAQSR